MFLICMSLENLPPTATRAVLMEDASGRCVVRRRFLLHIGVGAVTNMEGKPKQQFKPGNLKVLDQPLQKYLLPDGERRVRIVAKDHPDAMRAVTLVKVARRFEGFSLLEVTIKTGISFSSKPNPIKGIVFDVQLVRVQCRVVCAIANVHVRIEAANAASIVGTPSPPAHEVPRRYAGYPGALTQRVMHRASGMRADDFAGIDVDEVPSASRSRRGH